MTLSPSDSSMKRGATEPTGDTWVSVPKWVTPALLAATREVWQPYYDLALTEEDVLEILLGVGRLMEIISEDTP